jgi:hypothetical protein
VTFRPTQYAQADTAYTVQLFEKGNPRAITTITWDQPELNVFAIKSAQFALTQEEWDAYKGAYIGGIFTAKVIP